MSVLVRFVQVYPDPISDPAAEERVELAVYVSPQYVSGIQPAPAVSTPADPFSMILLGDECVGILVRGSVESVVAALEKGNEGSLGLTVRSAASAPQAGTTLSGG